MTGQDPKFDAGMRKVMELKDENRPQEQRVIFVVKSGMVSQVKAEVVL